MRKALGLLERHEAEALVAAKLDRLTRSLADFVELWQLAQRQDWAVLCLDQGLDSTTPMGRAMIQIACVFAELERERLRERLREAFEQKRQKGERMGRREVIDPQTQHWIESRVRQGDSLWKVTKALEKRTGRRWYVSTVQRTLNRHRTEPAN